MSYKMESEGRRLKRFIELIKNKLSAEELLELIYIYDEIRSKNFVPIKFKNGVGKSIKKVKKNKKKS